MSLVGLLWRRLFVRRKGIDVKPTDVFTLWDTFKTGSVAVAIVGAFGLLVIGVAFVLHGSFGWLEFGAAAWPVLTGVVAIIRMRWSNAKIEMKQDVLLQALPPEQVRRLAEATRAGK